MKFLNTACLYLILCWFLPLTTIGTPFSSNSWLFSLSNGPSQCFIRLLSFGLPKYLVLHLYAGNNDCLYNAKVESKSILYLNFRRKRVRIKGST